MRIWSIQDQTFSAAGAARLQMMFSKSFLLWKCSFMLSDRNRHIPVIRGINAAFYQFCSLSTSLILIFFHYFDRSSCAWKLRYFISWTSRLFSCMVLLSIFHTQKRDFPILWLIFLDGNIRRIFTFEIYIISNVLGRISRLLLHTYVITRIFQIGVVKKR